jgi:hypothetical protein
LSGKNLPSADVCARLHSEYRSGQSPLKLARLFDLSPRTVKLVLADETLAGVASVHVDRKAEPIVRVDAPKAEQPTEPAPVPYDYNTEEPASPAIRDPRHVNGMAERVGGVTINVATNPRGSDFQFTVTHRQPSAGWPERTEPSYPSTAAGTHFDLFTGKVL